MTNAERYEWEAKVKQMDEDKHTKNLKKFDDWVNDPNGEPEEAAVKLHKHEGKKQKHHHKKHHGHHKKEAKKEQKPQGLV